MNALTLTPLKGPVVASIHMPGSKSDTNRALILAALTRGSVSLKNPLASEDTHAMVECLQTLGIEIERKEDKWIVQGDIHSVKEKSYCLFAYDSGTTARFLLALLCIIPGIKTLQGSPRLNERPIHDLVVALRQLGAVIEYTEKEGALPVRVKTSQLVGADVFINGEISSQFCSALLLISPFLSEGLRIHVGGNLISKPYVDMTLGCMQDWGVSVKSQSEGIYWIEPGQSYQKKEARMEGDFSSAGYFFAIGALTCSTLSVHNLNPVSKQADRRFLQILQKMGNVVLWGENQVCIEGKQILPLDVDMQDCPDQVMTLAVLAAFAEGVTRISGVRSLRVKETERVLALKENLARMGIETKDTQDTLTIYGGAPHAAQIATYNDHRMAMAFAVAGMHLPGMIIDEPKVVNKTFPTFWETLRGLH